MKMSVRLAAVLFAALGLGFAPSAGAEEIRGSGWLDEVDLDGRTVTIGDKVFEISHVSEFESEDKQITFVELDRLREPWVRYAATEHAGKRVLRLLIVVPDDD